MIHKQDLKIIEEWLIHELYPIFNVIPKSCPRCASFKNPGNWIDCSLCDEEFREILRIYIEHSKIVLSSLARHDAIYWAIFLFRDSINDQSKDRYERLLRHMEAYHCHLLMGQIWDEENLSWR